MPVAVITGASRGIGRAITLRFATAGYDLVLAARNTDTLQRIAHEAGETGVRVEALPVDLTQARAAEELVEVARSAFGRIDVLVNNAGAAPLSPVAEMEQASFEQTMALNCAAVFHTTKFAWPLLAETHGVIVNISSVAAVDPFPGFAVYGACKSWVNLFTQATAGEGKPVGIRAYAIAPGAVDTDLLDGLFPDFPTEQRLAPAEVAEAVFSVTDPAWQHSSGQTIYVRK